MLTIRMLVDYIGSVLLCYLMYCAHALNCAYAINCAYALYL